MLGYEVDEQHVGIWDSMYTGSCDLSYDVFRIYLQSLKALNNGTGML